MTPSSDAASIKRKGVDETYGRAAKKNKNEQNEHDMWCDRVLQHGKTYVRNADMWTRPEFVLDAGLQAALGDSEDVATNDPELTPAQIQMQRRLLITYEKLKIIYRALEKDLAVDSDGNEDTLQGSIERLLRAGQKSARSSDTNTIKNGLASYHDFSPSIHDVQKNGRGYNNPQTGRLLCPLHMSWDDKEHVQRLQQGLEDLSSDVFYHFMYEGNEGDPQYAFDGLFRGPILVKAYRAIFFGPSSIRGEARSDTRSTRAGNAVLGCISSVSPSAIAYVCTLVRFALSSDSLMTSGDQHRFSHCGFYRAILEVMEPLEPSEFRKRFTNELLGWWNEQCFPHRDVSAPVNPNSTSSVALLLQQEAMAEMELAAADATTS